MIQLGQVLTMKTLLHLSHSVVCAASHKFVGDVILATLYDDDDDDDDDGDKA